MNRKVHKRNKKVVKMLRRIGFREPYQVIVEDGFVASINKSMLGLKHMTDLFKSQPKLFVTKCIYKRYDRDRKRGRDDFSKYLKILDCGHTEEEEPLQCLKRMIKKTNKNHYILGSNNREISEYIGKGKKVPVLTCRRGILSLEGDVEGTVTWKSLVTEADEEELRRLEMMFPEDTGECGDGHIGTDLS